MVDARSSDLRRDVDILSEQLKMSVERTEKSIEDLRNMVATLAAVVNANQQTGPDPAHSGEARRESHIDIKYQLNALLWSSLNFKLPNWDEYIRALHERFGAFVYEDPMVELVNLKQTGTIQEYLDKFDELMNYVDLSEPYTPPSPTTGPLPNYHSTSKSPSTLPEPLPHPLLLPGEEGAKEDEPGEQEVEEEGKEDTTVTSHVSMHALIGVHDFSTMRVTGNVKGKFVHLLIDIGNTHNFLDFNTAKRLGCRLETTTPFPVAVADGNKIYSSHLCKGFTRKMQGVEFTTKMLILPLGGCDAILGIQWLITLGDISCNFHQLKMKFHFKGSKVLSMSNSCDRLIHDDGKKAMKAWKKYVNDASAAAAFRKNLKRRRPIPQRGQIKMRIAAKAFQSLVSIISTSSAQYSGTPRKKSGQ
ncbi:hypothetical protein BUALT_Bualt05G0052100 [Buddleja alternifolia]|uniref:Retrotransposon gag domain-containing protein n=1 Tax=Buddleja alternifolia TaxID=168488 RepID=A0AAV6XNS3_9LAMI|nr:hypothetical protein BUALT_Bualt05G0052100 [Buddleja alternifolia]